jgi:hypothetical protein
MTRKVYIEQIRRLIYGGQPNDDATITVGLVNVWLNIAIGVAAQKNYTDNAAIDGIAYVNGSFYTTFKNLAIAKDELFKYKITLPQIPIGLGDDEGLGEITITDGTQTSYPVVLINQNQRTYNRSMRPIPNKLIGYSEGTFLYVLSSFPLYTLMAKVTMVSGGDSTNLNSMLNVPDNYFPIMTDYLLKNLVTELSRPVDTAQDGNDVNPSA